MIVEIKGYYQHKDRHLINVDQVESVSMYRNSGMSSKDNMILEVRLTNQILMIDFLSYEQECKRAYDAITQALLVHHQKYILGGE